MSTISSGDSGLRLSPASSISYLLHAIKKELQGATSSTRYVHNRQTRSSGMLKCESRASTGLNRNEVKSRNGLVAECFLYA